MVALGVGLDDFHRFELLEAGLLRYLVLSFVGVVLEVADVRYVADVAHLVAEVLEKAEQDVVGDARPGVAEVGFTIDGWTADVHPDVAGMYGCEEFLFAGKGVGKV